MHKIRMFLYSFFLTCGFTCFSSFYQKHYQIKENTLYFILKFIDWKCRLLVNFYFLFFGKDNFWYWFFLKFRGWNKCKDILTSSWRIYFIYFVSLILKITIKKMNVFHFYYAQLSLRITYLITGYGYLLKVN